VDKINLIVHTEFCSVVDIASIRTKKKQKTVSLLFFLSFLFQ